jgi:hypothetical protein
VEVNNSTDLSKKGRGNNDGKFSEVPKFRSSAGIPMEEFLWKNPYGRVLRTRASSREMENWSCGRMEWWNRTKPFRPLWIRVWRTSETVNKFLFSGVSTD